MRRVLITGCSTGIGRASAIELTRRGYEVVATARDVGTLADLDVARRLSLDVTDDDSVRSAVAVAGHIDVLVNNAGLGCWGPVEMVPFADVQRLVDTNVLGVVRMLQAVLPGMRESRGGTIVNISSAAGRVRGTAAIGFYSMTKHAIEALSEALRYEVIPFGIKVVIVEPGSIATNLQNTRIVAGLDGPPYAALSDGLQAAMKANATEPSPPELVAKIIADALEDEHPDLRHPAGPDAVAAAAAADQLTEDQAEAQFRAILTAS
jgi:NAD(P)-dependent dehydrogenase (short-subunit alcohol dehydrogenase family)